MKLIDTSYSMNYETRKESRERLFNTDKYYLVYWRIDGIINTTRIVIITDYSLVTDDFYWVWGIASDLMPYSINSELQSKILVKSLDYLYKRTSCNTHNPRCIVYELSASEVLNHVLMEVI